LIESNDRCINNLYAGRDVESAVEEMSAAMDADIVDSPKMLFSDVKTLVADPKQQHALTGILKRGMKTDVGNVVCRLGWYPMRSLFSTRPALNMVILHLGVLDNRHQSRRAP
jgi:hypothetical protein